MTKQIDPAKSATDRPALVFEIPPEALSAGVEALCDFEEDRGIRGHVGFSTFY